MKNASNPLGKGLNALLPSSLDLDDDDSSVNESREKAYFHCSVDKIRPNPYQPRKKMDGASLQELANSIQEKGVLQPLVVRKIDDAQGEYELIAGERRLRAAKLTALLKVPVLVVEAKEQDRLELALIENIQRQNLNPIEEGAAYNQLVKEFNLTQEEVAKRVGKERSTVTNTLRLLQLPDAVKNDIANSVLSMGHGRVLLALGDKETILHYRKIIVEKGLSVRQTEELVKSIKEASKKGAKHAPPVKSPIPKSYCQSITKDLVNFLGTKAKIIQKGEKGKLEIEYSSFDELERIHSLILNVDDLENIQNHIVSTDQPMPGEVEPVENDDKDLESM